MYHVMKRINFDKFITLSQHQDEFEAVRASKRWSRRTNESSFVMQEHGVAIPSIVVNFEQS